MSLAKHAIWAIALIGIATPIATCEVKTAPSRHEAFVKCVEAGRVPMECK